MNLQKRELLIFAEVLAFPKDSIIRLAFMIASVFDALLDGLHKKLRMCLVVSVLPEPDIPDMIMD